MEKVVSRCITVTTVIDGENGIDAKDAEWVYIRTKTNVPPTIYDDEHYTDSNSKKYTADDHLPRVNGSGRTDIETNGGSSSYPECTDDPKGIDETWCYEWEIKRTKGDANPTTGSRSWNYYQGQMTIHSHLAENVLIIDIDNDNDQFGVDADGKVLVQQTRSTVVSMLYGTQEQAFSSDPTATMKYDDGTSVASSVAEVAVAVVQNTSNKEYRVTVTIKATGANTPVFTNTGKNGIYVDISGTCAKGGPLSIRFSLEKVMSGAKGVSPVIYQLAPTQKSFSFGRDANNDLTPTSITSQIKVAETIGNTTTIKTLSDSGKTFTWGFDGSYTGGTITDDDKIVVSNSDAADHTEVCVLLSTGDRETLPITKDGLNVPSYIESQEAWSNDEKTSSATTSPTTDYSASAGQPGSAGNPKDADWYSYTPANANNYAYLWRRSRQMTLNQDGTSYTAGTWTYTRLSGTNGTSIKTKGKVVCVKTASSGFPTTGVSANSMAIVKTQAKLYKYSGSAWAQNGPTAVDGDSYTNEEDLHLWMWSAEANSGNGEWIDLGQFKGDSGTTYYTHIAWASAVDTTHPWSGSLPAGQISTPTVASASDVTGGSIAPFDGAKWMGVLINTSSGSDSTNWNYYTWQKVEGPKGDSAIRLALDNEHEDFLYSDAGLVSPSGGATSPVHLYDGQTEKTGDVTIQVYDDHADTWGQYTGMSASADASVSQSGSTATLTVAALRTDSVKVRVRAEYPVNSGQYYYAEFTANKTSQDKYDMVVNPNAIAYNPANYGNGVDIEVYANVTNLKGVTSRATIQTGATDGLRLYATYSGNEYRISTTTTDGTKMKIEVGSAIAAANTGIYLELRKYSGSSYVVVDHETVEIAKVQNGIDGKNQTSTDKYYKANSVESPPSWNNGQGWSSSVGDSGWNATNKYLYCRERPVYDNGTYGSFGSIYLHSVWGTSVDTYQVIAEFNGGDIPLVTFSKNFAGANTTPMPSTYTLKLLKNGEQISLPSGHSWYMKRGSGSWTLLSTSDTVYRSSQNIISDFSEGSYQTVTYGVGFADVNTGTEIICSKLVTMRWEVQRMLVPAGNWDSATTYTRTINTTPLVYYDVDGTYWFLVADSSTGNTPNNNSTYWQKASQFEVILAKMLMADYGKIASAVFFGDHMFSQYLANEKSMFSGYYSPSYYSGHPLDYYVVPNQSSLPVTAGTQYKISVTFSADKNHSEGMFARVLYNDESDWSGTTHITGSFKIRTTSSTSVTKDIVFVAEYSGYVKIDAYGYGEITAIIASVSASYDKVSPMFVNTDPIMLLDEDLGTSSTSYTNVVNVPIPIINGRQYKITFKGRVQGGLTGYVGVYYNGSVRHDTTFTGDDNLSGELNFTASATAEAYIQFKINNYYENLESTGYEVHVSSIYIQCTNSFVPKVDVNWLTGYAHFGGDSVRFNPDGSGHIASKSVSWDASGNIRMYGVSESLELRTDDSSMYTSIKAGRIEIRSKRTQSYGIFEINSLGEVILSMYDKDGNSVVNIGGTPNTLVNGRWDTLVLRERALNYSSDNRSYYTTYESDCTEYYEMILGRLVNGSTIQYYMPSSGAQTTDLDVIGRNNHVFTSKSSSVNEEYDIKNLSFIPNGWYVRPNDGYFATEFDTGKEHVTLYHYQNGIIVDSIDVEIKG